MIKHANSDGDLENSEGMFRSSIELRSPRAKKAFGRSHIEAETQGRGGDNVDKGQLPSGKTTDLPFRRTHDPTSLEVSH